MDTLELIDHSQYATTILVSSVSGDLQTQIINNDSDILQLQTDVASISASIPEVLSDLTDIDTTNVSAGQILVYSGTASEWQPEDQLIKCGTAIVSGTNDVIDSFLQVAGFTAQYVISIESTTGINIRASQVMIIHDGGVIAKVDESGPGDNGNTNDFNLDDDVSGGSVRLLGTTSDKTYNVSFKRIIA